MNKVVAILFCAILVGCSPIDNSEGGGKDVIITLPPSKIMPEANDTNLDKGFWPAEPSKKDGGDDECGMDSCG